MDRILVKHLVNNVGNEVTVLGYTENVREFRDFSFVFLRDRTGICQIVIPKEKYRDKIGREDVLSVEGEVTENKKSKYQGIEILANSISAISRGVRGRAIHGKESANITLEQKLERRVASFRLEEVRKTFEFESRLMKEFREFLYREEFIEVATPKIIALMNEGGAKKFSIDYFGKRASLSQSPQLHHQMLLTAFERVYEIGPCFRAEKYATQRHVNEYQSLDLEIAFIRDGDEVMSFLESMLNYSLEKIKSFVVGKIPRLNYEESSRILEKNCGGKLSGEEKGKIGKWVKNTFNSDFVFIHSFPLRLCQFYAMPRDDTYGDNFKLLYKGVEICAGGKRINELEMLKKSMINKGLDLGNYEYYLDAFELGIPPHGGLSLGLPRFVYLLRCLDNVKEAIYFPRDLRRLRP